MSELRFLAVVQQVMDRHGFRNNRQFLLAHGLNPNLLNKIKSGLQSPPQDVLAMLAERYKVNLNYIIVGQEPMFWEDDAAKPTARLYKVPFLAIPAWGSFAESYLDDHTHVLERELEILADAAPKPGSIALEVAGDSMADQLKEGTRVLVSPVNQAAWPYLNSGVFVVLFGSMLVIKRIKDNTLSRDGLLTLHSDNPMSGSLVVPAQDIRRVWQVDRVLDGKVR